MVGFLPEQSRQMFLNFLERKFFLTHGCATFKQVFKLLKKKVNNNVFIKVNDKSASTYIVLDETTDARTI